MTSPVDWVRLYSGVPPATLFGNTRGQGTPIVIDQDADIAYYLHPSGEVRPLSGVASSGGGGGTDLCIPDDYYIDSEAGHTVLLLHGDEFVDVSSNPKGVSPVSNAAISTAQPGVGSASFVTDGTDDCINVTNHEDFAFGTGDFTVELSIFPIDFASAPYVITHRDASNQGWYIALGFGGTTVGWGRSGIVNSFNTITAVLASEWTHLAVCRQDGVTRMFKKGLPVGSAFADTANYTGVTQPLVIGADYFGAGNRFNGFTQQVRITKGVARYTGAFAVPDRLFCAGG